MRKKIQDKLQLLGGKMRELPLFCVQARCRRYGTAIYKSWLYSSPIQAKLKRKDKV